MLKKVKKVISKPCLHVKQNAEKNQKGFYYMEVLVSLFILGWCSAGLLKITRIAQEESRLSLYRSIAFNQLLNLRALYFLKENALETYQEKWERQTESLLPSVQLSSKKSFIITSVFCIGQLEHRGLKEYFAIVPCKIALSCLWIKYFIMHTR